MKFCIRSGNKTVKHSWISWNFAYRSPYFSDERKGNGIWSSTVKPCDILKVKKHLYEVYVLLYFTENTNFNPIIEADVAYPYLDKPTTELFSE
jgi:hypothetical protein